MFQNANSIVLKRPHTCTIYKIQRMRLQRRLRGIFTVCSLIFTIPWRNPLAAVVHLNFRAGSTFPVQACTVPSSMDRTSQCSKVDAVRLYASYRLNLLLLKRQRCVNRKLDSFFVKLLNQLLNYYILGRIHDLASLYLKSFL